MDLAQLRRDAGLAREQLLKIVQEDTPFSYRKFSPLGGKGLTARLDNLVPDDYIVIVNNKNKEDYYRLPYKSFLNLLDIYQDELEDRRNRGASKIAQIKKRAQGNRDKGKPDLFLQNDRLFGILDRTRDAVKLSQSKRQAETFTAEASIPKRVLPPPPPKQELLEEPKFNYTTIPPTRGGLGGQNNNIIRADGILYTTDDLYVRDYRTGEIVGLSLTDYAHSELHFPERAVDGGNIRFNKGELVRHRLKLKMLSGDIEPDPDPKPLPEPDGIDKLIATGEIVPDGDEEVFGSLAYRRENVMDYYLVVDGEETDFPYAVNPAGEIFDDNMNIIAQLTDYPNDLKTYEWVDEKQHKKNIKAYEREVVSPSKDDDGSTMKIIYENVPYDLIEPTYDTHSELEGIIVYSDDIEEMGTWVNDDIKFTTNGFIMHVSDDRHKNETERRRKGIPKLILPKKIPDWFPQASSPEPEPEEESDEELVIENFAEEDEDDEDEAIYLRYEGVIYSIEPDMNVVDDDFEDVGKWVNGDIKFTKQGAKIHKNLRDPSADKIEWISNKRPK